MGSSRVVVAWPRADFHRSHPYVASTNTARTLLGIGSQTQMAKLKIMKEEVFQLMIFKHHNNNPFQLLSDDIMMPKISSILCGRCVISKGRYANLNSGRVTCTVLGLPKNNSKLHKI